MNQDETNMCYRVKTLRKELGLNQSDFGSKIEVAQSYLTNIETAKRPVTEKIFKLICLQSWSGKYVNDEWLRYGTGKIFLDLPPEDEVAAAVSGVLDDINCEKSLYTLIKEILIKYEEADPKTQEVLDNYFDRVLDGYHERKEG